MGVLGDNAFSLLISKRVLEMLAISNDRLHWPTIDQAMADQQVICDTHPYGPTFCSWIDMGLVDPAETAANGAMPFPRLLYASTNTDWQAPLGLPCTAGQLRARLQEFDDIASGPDASLIPAQPPEIPKNLRLTQDILDGVGQRVTFIREPFTKASPPSIEVLDDGIEVSWEGTAYRGPTFSRRFAMEAPTHDFRITLRYEIRATGATDLATSAIPFRMVADPPAGNPSLPDNGRLVFAVRQDGKYVLPNSQDDFADGGLFHGRLDDGIYESNDDASPRYVVESLASDRPHELVIREVDGSPLPLARGIGGRVYLDFVEVADVEFTPLEGADPISGGEIEAIRRSLVRFQPNLLSQLLGCEDPTTSFPIEALLFLGERGFDLPIMPRAVVMADCPQIVNGRVEAMEQYAELTVSTYFPESGAIGLSSDAPIPEDFSQSAAFSVALGSTFMQPTLDKTAVEVVKGLQAEPPTGLDPASVQATANLADGAISVHVSGSGVVKTPRILPNIPYDFDATVRSRFVAVPSIALGFDGTPRDRFNCPIPQPVLEGFGLDPQQRRYFLDEAAQNPLNFHAYLDRDDGLACFGCDPAHRIPAPIYDAARQPIAVEEPADPSLSFVGPDVCPDQPNGDKQQKDVLHRYGQASFADEGLHVQWDMSSVPPTKDDVDAKLKLKPWAIFVTALLATIAGGILGVFLFAFGFAGAAAIGSYVFMGLWLLLPFTNLIAGAILGSETRKRVADQNPEVLDAGVSVSPLMGIYLVQGDGPIDPVNIRENALITRYHVVIQASTLAQASSF